MRDRSEDDCKGVWMREGGMEKEEEMDGWEEEEKSIV